MQMRLARQPRTQIFVVLRRQIDRARKRADVEAGSSRDDGAFAARVNVFDGIYRVGCEARRRVALIRIQEADEVMRHGRELLRRGRRSSNRHVAINLARVGADDFGAEPLRECDREFGLSRRGRSGDHEHAG